MTYLLDPVEAVVEGVIVFPQKASKELAEVVIQRN